jgi:NAD(P)-dependent dehydrogenase (short-subunit alcohol dehydrogenase family)
MTDQQTGAPLLSGKVAVVVGGASGIGQAIAVALARHGAAAIVVADIRRDPREGGTPTDELVRGQDGAEGVYVACDVTEPEQVDQAVLAARQFGGVDIMVNSAGIVEPAAFGDIDPAGIERIVRINMLGAVYGCQSAIREMTAKRSGSIVNIASVTAVTASYGAMYSATKAGVTRLSASLASQYGPQGIRVNVIHPGLTETAMTRLDGQLVGTPAGASRLAQIPLGRFGLPEDMANAAVYLASDLASYVTGTAITVDGGWSAHLPGVD